MWREIIVVCSQINTEHIKTLWAKHRTAECETAGTYSDHWVLEGQGINKLKCEMRIRQHKGD